MPRFRIVPERSELWAVVRATLHKTEVRATRFEGYFDGEIVDGRFEPGPQPSGRLTVHVEGLSSGDPLFDRQLMEAVEGRKYTRIAGDLRTAKPTGGDGFEVSGELRLHGVTRQVKGQVKVTAEAGGVVRVEGEASFEMTDFGLEPPRLLMLRVAPEIPVYGRVLAEVVA